ncbi:hypothetical protein TNCV_485091 [Trichonephila clavipes]|nr:hypothetical protein TNCV_485091 [Trichonephila clavipes]
MGHAVSIKFAIQRLLQWEKLFQSPLSSGLPLKLIVNTAVGSLVVRASDSRSEGLCLMPDSTKYPPSTHGLRARYINGSESLVS